MKKSSALLMIIGTILLLGLFFYPLWNIKLVAPQYPEGLGMNIYISGIEGVEKNDIVNIDGLNHYIGMRKIPKNDEMWEFDVFPLVVGGMVAIGVIIGIFGLIGKLNYKAFLAWLVVMGILGILGMYDFNQWLMDYGGNLDPNASIKLLNEKGEPMTYKPPLIGYQKMLNFDVWSRPAKGAYLMFAGMILVTISIITGFISHKKESKA